MSVHPDQTLPRPSTWFAWHTRFFGPGVRVLDLACGEGRHSLTAAALGARVTAVDRDAAKLAEGAALAAARGLEIDWREADLERPWPELGTFDVVLVFNYLDRDRMADIRGRVAPGGALVMETFLDAQRELGWGPSDARHFLRPGELARLVRPLEVFMGREVVEPVDERRWRSVASVVALKGKAG